MVKLKTWCQKVFFWALIALAALFGVAALKGGNISLNVIVAAICITAALLVQRKKYRSALSALVGLAILYGLWLLLAFGLS